MPWLKHPTYVPARDWLVEVLRQRIIHFGQSQPLVFVCGGENSTRRELLAAYLRAQTDAFVFFAEDVWSAVAEDPDSDALSMEKRLAELADMVVIIVESAGSIAELGAFCLSAELQQKLLPILETQYKARPSFINTGPIRTSDKNSRFRPAIHTNFDMILRCASEVVSRLDLVRRKQRTVTLGEVRENRKYLLLFLISLVGIVHPVTEHHLGYYLKRILGRAQSRRLKELLHLGISLGILRKSDHRDPSTGEIYTFFSTLKMPDLLSEASVPRNLARARIANSLQRIPFAEAVTADLTSQRTDSSHAT